MSFVTYSALGQNGRLGNQLFQIAATISYSIKYGKEAIFPYWDYNEYLNEPLDVGFGNVNSKYFEPNFHHTDIPFIEGNVDLNGYFQSEKYFVNHSSLIKHSIFNPSVLYSQMVSRKYMELNDSGERTLAIHVRRGDYLNPKTSEYHGVLDWDYYKRAMDAIYPFGTDGVKILIFTDEPDWCKENISLQNSVVVEGNKDIVDLWLMAKCHDFIIANSSFSWWAGWLNKNTNKIVVSPSCKWGNWFGISAGVKIDCVDLIPSTWEQIEFRTIDREAYKENAEQETQRWIKLSRNGNI